MLDMVGNTEDNEARAQSTENEGRVVRHEVREVGRGTDEKDLKNFRMFARI